jgi:hypothetical protein
MNLPNAVDRFWWHLEGLGTATISRQAGGLSNNNLNARMKPSGRFARLGQASVLLLSAEAFIVHCITADGDYNRRAMSGNRSSSRGFDTGGWAWYNNEN